MLHNGDSLASCNVISPKTYRSYAWPSQVKVFEAWAAHGIDRKLLHICGDSTRVLDDYASTGADMVEIDDAVDMAVAKERIGDRVALVGNVHTVVELLQGTPESVCRGGAALHRRGGRGRRFPAGVGLHCAALFAAGECAGDGGHGAWAGVYPGMGRAEHGVQGGESDALQG